MSLKILINPLQIAYDIKSEKDMLHVLCSNNVARDLDTIKLRWSEITTFSGDDKLLSTIPYDKEFFSKVVEPLRNAKVCYCLGNTLGTIALACTVGEMIAIFLHKLYGASSNNKFKEFERAKQIERIGKLRDDGHINIECHDILEKVKNTRNAVLHRWSYDVANSDDDAKNVYKNIIIVLSKTLEIEIAKGGLKIGQNTYTLFKESFVNT